MREHLRINRTQLAYIIPAALYTLWQSCVGWLNHYWTFIRLGREPAALLYITFFLAHAAGTAAFAWWLDRSPDMKKIRRALIVSSILSCFFTAAMAYSTDTLLLPVCLLQGLVSGLFMAYLTFFVFAQIPINRRGITIGTAAALGVAIHFVAFVLLFPQQEGNVLYGKTFFAAIVVLLIGVSARYWPAGRNCLCPPRTDANLADDNLGSLKPGLIVPLLLIVLGFFISYGMQDYAATVFWLDGEDYLVYTRLFLIAGFIAGGLLCDLRGKHMVLNGSFSLLALGFVSMAFQYKGAFAFIGFSGVQMAGAVFSVGTRLLFLDIARFYKKTALVCSLGLVFPLILKQVGIISASILYKTLGNMSIFLVSLVAIIAVLPLVSSLFDKFTNTVMTSFRLQTTGLNLASSLGAISDSPEADPVDTQVDMRPESNIPVNNGLVEVADPVSWTDAAKEFAQRYGLNPRETQVLELTLHGLSLAEMAKTLNIAETTAKQYIRQMLRKTETKNRRELLSKLIKEKSSPP